MDPRTKDRIKEQIKKKIKIEGEEITESNVDLYLNTIEDMLTDLRGVVSEPLTQRPSGLDEEGLRRVNDMVDEIQDYVKRLVRELR